MKHISAIRKYIEENAGLKKQVEDFMKEKEAQLKEKLRKSMSYNNCEVCDDCTVLVFGCRCDGSAGEAGQTDLCPVLPGYECERDCRSGGRRPKPCP